MSTAASRGNPSGRALALALGALLTAGGGLLGQQSLTLSEEAKKNLQIELAPAARTDIHDVLEISGLLREQSDRVAWCTPPTRGIIARVLVKKADKVRKGDVVAMLHCPEAEKLRTDLAQGAVKVKLLEAERDRARSLVEKKILAGRDLLRAETELALAVAAADAARRGLYLLGLSEEELADLLARPEQPAFVPLHAPINGHVTEMEAYQGDTADPTRRLIRIMDVSVLWAEGDVFERDVPRIRRGQEVALVLRPFEDWKATGTIEAISADLNAARRTAHLWITVPNPEEKLKPQMAVSISILLKKKEGVLAVPNEAVLAEQAETFVFVANGDAFLRQKIVTGMKDQKSTEIIQGLYEGDQVVTRGSHELKLALGAQGQKPGSDGHAH